MLMPLTWLPSAPHPTAPISAPFQGISCRALPGGLQAVVKGTPEILLLFLPGTPNLGFRAFLSLTTLWEGAFCEAKIKMSPCTPLGILWRLGRGKGAAPRYSSPHDNLSLLAQTRSTT